MEIYGIYRALRSAGRGVYRGFQNPAARQQARHPEIRVRTPVEMREEVRMQVGSVMRAAWFYQNQIINGAMPLHPRLMDLVNLPAVVPPAAPGVTMPNQAALDSVREAWDEFPIKTLHHLNFMAEHQRETDYEKIRFGRKADDALRNMQLKKELIKQERELFRQLNQLINDKVFNFLMKLLEDIIKACG